MADKFEDLRNYAAVVENGGVNAAAAALGIAKSAVSRRLGELEARLGVSLVERTNRRFELTALGRDYYAKASVILASLDALDAGIGDSSAVTTVKVMSDPLLMTHLVAPVLAAFLVGEQAVSIELVNANEVPRQMDADTLLVTIDSGNGDLTATALTRTTRVVCAAHSYLSAHGMPANLADLHAHTGVSVLGDRGGWTFPGGPARPPSVRLTVPNVESAMAAAIDGAGLVHLPDFLVSKPIGRGELLAVLKDTPAVVMQVKAVHRRDCEVAVSRLLDHLVRSLRERR